MASYQFDIESDSDTEERDTGNYNSRTVVLGGGRVSYVKQDGERSSPKKKSAEKKIEEKKIATPPATADRIRPVSLPIERKLAEPEKKPGDPEIAYKFKKIPWQLPKAPLDFPPPLNVPRVDVENLAPPPPVGEYTLVNPPKAQNTRPPRPAQFLTGSDKKNTRFCQFVKFDVNKGEQSVVSVENKCRNAGCNFAHTMDVYAPMPCTYQAACNNGDSCKFFHSNRETKFEYYLRSSLFPPPRPPTAVQQRFRKQ